MPHRLLLLLGLFACVACVVRAQNLLGNGTLEGTYVSGVAPERCAAGKSLAPVERAEPGLNGIEFGRGVRELARAIGANRPHPSSAAHAAHVIEVMEAIDRSAEENGSPRRVTSRIPSPLLAGGAWV